MSRRVIVVGVMLVAAVGAYFVVPRLAGKGAAAVPPGMMVLDVAGRYHAKFALPAVVNWCPVTRVAEFEGIAIDTGVVVALREGNAISEGPHPIFTVEMAPQAPRPNATAALRWLRQDDTTVVAYRATSGHVDLDEVGATISGSLTLHLLNAAGTDSVLVQGRFAGVKIRAMAAGCT